MHNGAVACNEDVIAPRGAEAAADLRARTGRKAHLHIHRNVDAGIALVLKCVDLLRGGAAGDRDCVARRVYAKIPVCTAAHLRLQADVVLILRRQIEVQPPLNHLQLAPFVALQRLHDLPRLRVVKILDGLEDNFARRLPRRLDAVKLLFVGDQGLFAKHVLSRLQRSDCPLLVHGIGERVVDYVDIIGTNELLIAAIGSANVLLVGVGLCLLQAAACHRDKLAACGLAQRPEHRVVDLCG